MRSVDASRSLLIGVWLALAAFPAPAAAQDTRWYVGLGIGSVKTGDACPAAAPGTDCEDKDTAWKILGGYQLNRYLGYELALSDMGERPASLAGIGPATAHFRIFEAVLVGTAPLGERFAVYGKAGIFAWDIDYDLPAGFVGSADANGNDYSYGLGVKYQFSRSFAVRLEWQRYADVGDRASTGRFDADTLGIGALFSF